MGTYQGAIDQAPVFGDAGSVITTTTKLLAQTDDFVTQLAANGFYTPLTVTANFPGFATPPVPQLPGTPTLETVTWVTPTQPGAFTAPPPNLANLFPVAFNGQSPTLNFGSLPQPAYGAIPSSPSVDLNFTYPTPVVTLPTAPHLLSLDTIPFNAADYTIPTFTGVAPVLALTPPNVIPFSEPASFTSTLLTDITNDLQNAIVDDNATGLSVAAQRGIMDAAYEREYRTQADALASLNRDQELLGYALPSGVWADERLKIYTETNATMAGLSRDIFVKQSEMRLENVMKCRELSISLESKLIDQANMVAQRAFETAKYETEAAISVYNANVEVFKARIEGFRATIEVYNAQIEGIKARVQVLTAEVEFETAKAEINTAIVEQYNGQIKAAEAILDVARIQVEIIQTQANVEKTKVDVFSAQVQAFVATVNAYTAEVEGYKANAEAQGAIENVYRTQVEAYSAQVQAGAAQATALVEGYKAQVQSYEAQLEGYKAALQAMVEQARAASEYNQSATAEYTAQVQALGTYNEVLVKEWQAILDEGIQYAGMQMKASEANAQLALSARNISIEAIKGAASVMAQLGAAALGAIHWSNSSQWSDSYNHDMTKSQPTYSNSDDHVYSSSV